jgi:hypothetical protein
MTDGVATVFAVAGDAADTDLSRSSDDSDSPQLPSIPARTKPRREVSWSELMIPDI